MKKETTLAEEGFLADEIQAVVEDIQDRYSKHLSELYALNRLLTSAQYQLDIDRENAIELTAGVLFVRSLAHCQAAIILIERGMLPSASAIARCAIEGLFNLGACASDYQTALDFLDADQADRQRKAKYLKKYCESNKDAKLDKAELDRIAQEIDNKVKELSAKELKVRGMAEKANLESMYLIEYSMLSGSVHSTAGDLDKHFQWDRENDKVSMLTEPSVKDLEITMLIIGTTMIKIIGIVDDLFKIKILKKCEQHYNKLTVLYED